MKNPFNSIWKIPAIQPEKSLQFNVKNIFVSIQSENSLPFNVKKSLEFEVKISSIRCEKVSTIRLQFDAVKRVTIDEIVEKYSLFICTTPDAHWQKGANFTVIQHSHYPELNPVWKITIFSIDNKTSRSNLLSNTNLIALSLIAPSLIAPITHVLSGTRNSNNKRDKFFNIQFWWKVLSITWKITT